MPSVLRNGDETRRAARRSAPFSAARREAGSLVASFNYAFEGVIYVVRTQRNMRIHFLVALAVLPLGVVLGASRFEMLALMLSVSFVLIAEMFNTALEKAIDLATGTFDPVARAAKDIAAGAVLVAAVNALFVGYLVFGPRLQHPSQSRDRHGPHSPPAHHRDRDRRRHPARDRDQGAGSARGTPLRGGLPSGHAAVAFGGWAAVTFITQSYENQVLVSTPASTRPREQDQPETLK